MAMEDRKAQKGDGEKVDDKCMALEMALAPPIHIRTMGKPGKSGKSGKGGRPRQIPNPADPVSQAILHGVSGLPASTSCPHGFGQELGCMSLRTMMEVWTSWACWSGPRGRLNLPFKP